MINGHIISFDLFDRKLYLNSKNGDILSISDNLTSHIGYFDHP